MLPVGPGSKPLLAGGVGSGEEDGADRAETSRWFPFDVCGLALGTAGLGHAWVLAASDDSICRDLGLMPNTARCGAHACCALSLVLLLVVAAESSAVAAGRRAVPRLLGEVGCGATRTPSAATACMAMMLNCYDFAMYGGADAALGVWRVLWAVAVLCHGAALVSFVLHVRCVVLTASRSRSGGGGRECLRALLGAMTNLFVVPPVGIGVAVTSGACFSAGPGLGAAVAEQLRRVGYCVSLSSLLVMAPLLAARVASAWPACGARHMPLPPGMAATTAVLAAPFGVALTAVLKMRYLPISEAALRALAGVLIGLNAAALVTLALHARRIAAEGFQPSWSALTFPLAISVAGALSWRAAGYAVGGWAGASAAWAEALLLVATAVVVGVWCGTLRHAWCTGMSTGRMSLLYEYEYAH